MHYRKAACCDLLERCTARPRASHPARAPPAAATTALHRLMPSTFLFDSSSAAAPLVTPPPPGARRAHRWTGGRDVRTQVDGMYALRCGTRRPGANLTSVKGSSPAPSWAMSWALPSMRATPSWRGCCRQVHMHAPPAPVREAVCAQRPEQAHADTLARTCLPRMIGLRCWGLVLRMSLRASPLCIQTGRGDTW
jgi:hypothetical protein